MSVLSTIVFSLSALLRIHAEHVHFWHVLLAIFIALVMSVSGDAIDFCIGKYTNKLLNHWKFFQKHFSEQELARGEQFVQRYGKMAIFFSRYIPGIRTITSYVIGASNYSFPIYVSLNILANLIMLTLYALFGYFLGGIPFVKEHFVVIVMLLVLLPLIPSLYFTWKKNKKDSSEKTEK